MNSNECPDVAERYVATNQSSSLRCKTRDDATMRRLDRLASSFPLSGVWA